jgi:hypothetical protein
LGASVACYIGDGKAPSVAYTRKVITYGKAKEGKKTIMYVTVGI